MESSADDNNPSGLAMGSERAEAIANMEAMGFERSQIEAAMRAAFNNPDRAVEYLLTVSQLQGILCPSTRRLTHFLFHRVSPKIFSSSHSSQGKLLPHPHRPQQLLSREAMMMGT